MDTGEEAVPALGAQECEITWLETQTGHVRAQDLQTLFFQANEEKQWT